MARALRVDKLTLAALEATLRGPDTPTAAALHADPGELRRRADAIAASLGDVALVVPSDGAVGGGSAPGVALAGWAVRLPMDFAAALRAGDPAVVGRIERGHCLLDVRCVDPADDDTVVAAVLACM
jgi:L-seryl-tRNA(Ser) seleniumtransferase